MFAGQLLFKYDILSIRNRFLVTPQLILKYPKSEYFNKYYSWGDKLEDFWRFLEKAVEYGINLGADFIEARAERINKLYINLSQVRNCRL